MKTPKIIIIGAGLTGLALAYYLKQKGFTFLILEARDRPGGRIETHRKEGAAPIEMGATWVGKQHTALLSLIEELGLGVFEQKLGDRAIFEPISTSPPQLVQLPPNNDPSFRIQGGTDQLIDALVEKIGAANIHLAEAVTSLHEVGEQLQVETVENSYVADKVISTLPPYLFAKSIKVLPALPVNLLEIAAQTHTWMGESIKVGLNFETAFWEQPHLSGTVFSNVGPIPELYDHSNVEGTQFALKGFFNGAYFSVSKEERLERVLRQLRKYFGDQIDTFTHYEELVWKNERFTSLPYTSHILPHQNNGHALYQNAYLGGKLFLGGTETSPQFGGYMEGAIRSASYLLTSFF